jgi:hypothetical protein
MVFILVGCNVDETKLSNPILNQTKFQMFWEIFKNEGFINLKKF